MKRLTLSTLLCIGAIGGISQVSDAFAPWMSTPASSETAQPYGKQIRYLSNPDTLQAAIQRLIEAGPRAVPTLVDAALTHRDVTTRGWAIHGLAAIESGDARATLEELAADADEDRLIRTWAWAALINQANDLDELSALATEAGGFQALERPISLRAVALAGMPKTPPRSST